MKARRIVAALIVLLAAGGAATLLFSDRLSLRSNAAPSLTLYGNVDIRQVELGFRVPGRIAELLVDEGDVVEEGAVLARLDTRANEDAVRAAAAEVAAQEANVAKLEAGSRPAEIAQARAAVTERTATLQSLRRNHGRLGQLLKSGAIAQSSFDDASSALEEAEARLLSAKKTLQIASEGARREDIAAAKARLEVAKANLASAETALADTKILAPSGGVVLSRVREKGAIVSPADPVFVYSLTRPVLVRAYVSEPQLGRIRQGLEVEVVGDLTPERPYKGRIGFVSPVAEFTPKSVETEDLRTDLVYRLRVIVDAPDEALRQGMPVTVRVPKAG